MFYFTLYKKYRKYTNKVCSFFLSKELKINALYIEYPFRFIRPELMQFGSNVDIGADARIECFGKQNGGPKLILGNRVHLGRRIHIGAANKVIIGNDVLTGSDVFITDHSHGETTYEAMQLPPTQRPLFSKGIVVIEDNVWLGDKVCVLPHVRIGHNSIIGAGAVVTHDIPPYSVACGCPAQVIKSLQEKE